MDTIAAIQARRSIRRFKPDPVPQALIRAVLQAGIDAPSAKNRQPWRLVVVQRERQGMCDAMRNGLQWLEANGGASPEDRALLAGAWHTLRIMEAAPVTIFILNPHGTSPFEGLEALGPRFGELANVQSVGAAIQNMCLAAVEKGLGTLWIADVYSAYPTLTQWLGTDAQLVAALSLGYPDEAPAARPRMDMEEVVSWR